VPLVKVVLQEDKRVTIVRRPGCDIRCPYSSCWWVSPAEWRAESSGDQRQIWADAAETADRRSLLTHRRDARAIKLRIRAEQLND